VINLAKFKTHSQMTLTLGVKNTFGCVVGLKKPEWHMRAGLDKTLFARLIVQIHQAIAPAFTLIDGILGMDGDGPGKAGRPVPLGLLIGSRSAFAADHAACDLIGMPPEGLPTLAAAETLGISHDPARITGDGPDRIDFRLPEAGRTRFGPGWLQPLLRRHLLRRPVADADTCRLCGECWQYCPADAIQCRDDRLCFDYNRCIRCYCCIEVCPHGALISADPLPARFLHRLRPGKR
jgi:Pyruvate/2-oxoacid:ferredoxin oxidoreductase delta subunit